MLMPRALSSSEKMSKVSVSAQDAPPACAVTSKSSFVYSLLGEEYFGVWGVMPSMRVTSKLWALFPMACSAARALSVSRPFRVAFCLLSVLSAYTVTDRCTEAVFMRSKGSSLTVR